MFHQILRSRILLTIILSSIVVGILLVCSPILHVLNKNIQNSYYIFRNTVFPPTIPNNIVVSPIDKKTLDTLGRFPFPRDVYATFIKNAQSAGAATIGFDILFVEKSDSQNDRIFQQSLEESTIPIILGSAITGENTIETPLGSFGDSSFSTGFLPPNVNISNNRVYSFSPFLQFPSGSYEHFSLATLRGFFSYLWDDDLRKQDYGFSSPRFYDFLPSLDIPLSSQGNNDILISYIPSEKFRQISFLDIYDEQSLFEHDLQDTIILVGTAADGIKDEFFTPYGLEYGIFVHANIIQTILSRDFLMYFDRKLEWLLLFLLILTSVYFNLGYSRKALILSNVLLAFLFIIAIPVAIFLFTNLLMNYPVEILVALILSQTLSNGVKYFIEDKNKQRLKQSLSEYVGSDIAEEVLEEGGKINFDGEEKKSILFFSDIEGFTTMSEKLLPRDLVGFLREYLSAMSNIILDEKGYINKYEGDAIMALWGVFSQLQPDDYIRACRASIVQIKFLENLNKDWLKHYGQQVHIRIGLHAGDVIVGNIGAEGRKMEFTALGDTVNIASRLEGVNKFYGTNICVSESMYTQTRDHFEYRFLDNIRVKGKQKPLKIYELVCETGSLTDTQKDIFQKFQVALDIYFSKEFQKAKLLFHELVELGDKPSLTFKSRCSMYLLHPPEQDWDGVWQMEAK